MKYRYHHFKKSQEFVLRGVVTFNILTISGHCNARGAPFVCNNMFNMSLALETKMFRGWK